MNKKKWYRLLLLVILLFLEIRGRTEQVQFFINQNNVRQQETVLRMNSSHLSPEDSCTEELLNQNNGIVRGMHLRSFSQTKLLQFCTLLLFFSSFCVVRILERDSGFFPPFDNVLTHILSYIHKGDGKKRSAMINF